MAKLAMKKLVTFCILRLVETTQMTRLLPKMDTNEMLKYKMNKTTTKPVKKYTLSTKQKWRTAVEFTCSHRIQVRVGVTQSEFSDFFIPAINIVLDHQSLIFNNGRRIHFSSWCVISTFSNLTWWASIEVDHKCEFVHTWFCYDSSFQMKSFRRSIAAAYDQVSERPRGPLPACCCSGGRCCS